MTFPMDGSVRAPGILPRDRALVLGGAISNAAVIVHHVPGRLRLRAARAQLGVARLETLCSQLEVLPGVCSATPNAVTGSVLINYDPLILRPDALCAALQGCGFELIGNEEAAHDRLQGDLLGKVLEAVLERLAIAVIAAAV